MTAADDLREKVARAMYEADRHPWPWESDEHDERDAYCFLADAALAVVDTDLAEAWDEGHEVCEWPSCARRHRNPYLGVREHEQEADQ